MKRTDQNDKSMPDDNYIWRETLKKVFDGSFIQFQDKDLGIDEEDLQILRWICEYSDKGFCPPPEDKHRNENSSPEFENEATFNKIDAACFNHLASVHSLGDITLAVDIMKEIMSP